MYIYKIFIALISLYFLFEFTIGSRIDYYTKKLETLKDHETRIQFKDKILDELKKASAKKNYFTQEERIIISNFLRKISSELDLYK